ncbi:MAG: zinc metallopeptidase [Clostridia bacterium]|nr:zinc metallopeptidase [Clostridia bacterium]
MEIMDIVLYSLIGVLFIALAIGLGVANTAGQNLIGTYKEYERHIVDYITPISFVENVSRGEFQGKIRSEVCPGFLSDHYYRGTISLSQETVKTSSVSSMAVTAHELGHALQYRDIPQNMAKFNKKRRLSRILGKLTMPLFVVGLVCIIFSIVASIIVMALSFLLFCYGLFVQLSTIKIEKDASKRALGLLQQYAYMDEEQIKKAKKVLASASMTYVASFLKSVLSWTMLVQKYDFY